MSELTNEDVMKTMVAKQKIIISDLLEKVMILEIRNEFLVKDRGNSKQSSLDVDEITNDINIIKKTPFKRG
tara:strand:+ start:618 stop:830 length:213 start_codon:yes stop_codon:yes gene_type:complete